MPALRRAPRFDFSAFSGDGLRGRVSVTIVQNLGRRVSELDGVRGIAVILVLLFHFTGPYWTVHPDAFSSRVLSAGWIGVDLFFVLSGYLVTRRFWTYGQTTQQRLRVFWRNRALRIFPAYYLFLFAASSLDDTPGWSYWLYAHNWTQPWASQEILSFRSHLWSLAVEEQFYLFWPLILAAAGRRMGVQVAIAGTLVALVARVVGLADDLPAQFVYRTTVCRMDALLLGSAMALAVRAPVRAMAVTGTILVLGCWISLGGLPFDHALVQTVGYSGLAIGFAGAVRWVSDQGGPQWLNVRPLRLAGRYSYGAYLLHWPIALAVWPSVSALQLTWPAALGLACVESLVSLGLAFVLFEAFEKHFLRLKSKGLS